MKEFTLVVGTGMVAACLSSLVLGSFMSWLVVACRWLGVDPDNIASPLAATLGDLLTLFIMALVGAMLVKTIDTSVPFVVVLVMCGLTAGIWFALRMMARRRGKQELEEESEEGGWSPLVSTRVLGSRQELKEADRRNDHLLGDGTRAGSECESVQGVCTSCNQYHRDRGEHRCDSVSLLSGLRGSS
jgi:hypothetical protein